MRRIKDSLAPNIEIALLGTRHREFYQMTKINGKKSVFLCTCLTPVFEKSHFQGHVVTKELKDQPLIFAHPELFTLKSSPA